MKIYYATVNTGSPATGFISTGEVLTEEQAAALGEEKLAELVNAGVLAIGGETAKGETDTDDQAGAESAGGADVIADAGEPTEAEEPEAADEEELPELDLADELVGEAEPEEKPKRNSRSKGGKAK